MSKVSASCAFVYREQCGRSGQYMLARIHSRVLISAAVTGISYAAKSRLSACSPTKLKKHAMPKLLDHYGFDDLNLPTLQAYRNAFKSVKSDHPWVDLDDKEFLCNIGGWTKNRETGREGLTVAGVLMFGKLRSILDVLPNYVVDYQERPTDPNDARRWMDRVTTDGTWSGNLYDFFRTAIQRLTRDLKVPFRLKGTTRVDDTPVHEALREALVNEIIHADFTGRLSLLVVKRADMFGFSNPGVMRMPIEQAIRGGGKRLP